MITAIGLTLALAASSPASDEKRATCQAFGLWAAQVVQMRDSGLPLSDVTTTVEDRANPAFVPSMKRIAKLIYRMDIDEPQAEKLIVDGCISGLS